MKKIVLILSFVFYVFSSSFAQQEKLIRVLIMKDADTLFLKVAGNFEVKDAVTNRHLFRGRNLRTAVTSYAGGILIANKKLGAKRISILSGDPDQIAINNRVFRGDIQISRKEGGKLQVVNYINLEDYVKGIAIRETSHYWSLEALKAQAIVFRSFALFKMEENRLKDYDVTSDVYSQAYGGQAAERYRINRAIEETKGEILFFKSEVLPAFYHATCAGYTEDASLLWDLNLAPLKGVACGFCKGSPHFKWHYVLSTKELNEKLTHGGLEVPSSLKSISVIGRDKSGRITYLELKGDRGFLKISAKELRNLVGPDSIRSTNFQVNLVDDDIVFEGLGWGHGVGLCQWGAYFMAREGKSAQEILNYYYPGSYVKGI
jgi:stage II sporulation protein D